MKSKRRIRVPGLRGLRNALRRLWNWLRADAAVKVVCLLVASVVFWLIHVVGQEERTLRVPVEAISFVGPQAIAKIEPAEVKVRVRGPADRVLGLSPDGLRLRAGRAPQRGEPTLTVWLRRWMLRRTDGSQALPDFVRVVSFEPRRITMYFDEEVEREFPILMPRLTRP